MRLEKRRRAIASSIVASPVSLPAAGAPNGNPFAEWFVSFSDLNMLRIDDPFLTRSEIDLRL